VREKRRNRREYCCNSVSDFSRFHFVSPWRNAKRKTLCFL
jgi:hypothetical protein